jgi:hypothetical protein
MPLHFDWTVTLGTVLAAVSITAGTWASVSRLYSLLDKRLSLFEATMTYHAAMLTRHDVRMEKLDDAVVGLAGELQRVLGRLEQFQLNAKTSNHG